jgi:ketosteroid isomerase-like protein
MTARDHMGPAESIHALFTAWESASPEDLAGLFTADGVYQDPLKEGPLTGRDEIRDGNAAAMSAIEECRITVGRLVADGDVGFCEGFFSSRLRDGTGRLDFPFALVVEMHDGQIARAGEYFDTRPLLA